VTRSGIARKGDVLSRSPLSVLAVSNDALRPELLDRLLVEDNCNVIVVESIERAYARIRQVQPHVVVVFMNIDDIDACQLLSMLHMDRGLRGTSVVTSTIGPEADATYHVRDFEQRCDSWQPMASC
jgi:CheY-like chemotaxis protein